MSAPDHRYDEAARSAVYRVIHERRDMRHFLPQPVAADTLRHENRWPADGDTP